MCSSKNWKIFKTIPAEDSRQDGGSGICICLYLRLGCSCMRLYFSAKLSIWPCGMHVAVWHNNKRVVAERNVDVKHNSLINTSAWINEHIRTAAHRGTCLSGTPRLTTLGQTWRSWKKKFKEEKSSKYLIISPKFQRKQFCLFSLPLWTFFRPLKLNVNICTFIELVSWKHPL